MANMLKKDKKTARVPIIFITAKDTENDTVTGFNLGADDYISSLSPARSDRPCESRTEAYRHDGDGKGA